MLTPYLFDPTKPVTIEEQIEYFDKLQNPHRAKDLSSYLDTHELEQFQQNQSSLSQDHKALDLCRSSVEVIIRALVHDEGVTREQAEQMVYLGLGSENELLPQFKQLVQSTTPASTLLLNTAADLHCQLMRKIFTVALQLNLSDFRSLFPERFCVHDPDTVIKKLKDPDFVPTPEERKTHFAKNKELSFSILNAMSTWEIASMIPMQSMQVLQNAARYNVLKAVFSEQPQQKESQPVQLRNELNGTDV